MPRMTEKPIVTVRVMIYNNASKLHETIDSIMMQDYDAIEVIISDDGSTDPDRELLEKERQRAAEAPSMNAVSPSCFPSKERSSP